jgi:putative nucleotidyltransferase with HDIG domain
MDGSKTAKFQMSGTLKALLRILLLLVSACLPYYFRLILGMEVDLADFLYAPVVLIVLWWPTRGTIVALSLSLLLPIFPLFVEPATPLLYNLQRGLTLFAIALLVSALSRQTKEAEQEIRQRNKELRDSFKGIIAALASAIDARDPYTYGHSERVAQYSSEIGRELGLEPHEVVTIHYAGLLHDIGKIGISEQPLHKPDALDVEEWDVMKAHPIIGAGILEPVPLLEEIVPLVSHHHERYDGTGYPNRLAREKTPLGARILAVADAFEAMTSHRPYRPALSPAKAIAVLQKGMGKQWDAEVVEALLRILEKEALRCGVGDSPELLPVLRDTRDERRREDRRTTHS